MFNRVIDLNAVIKRKSVFLFGPRQTGKSFLLKKSYPDAIYYDLLKSDLFFRLSANPSLLREELTASDAWDHTPGQSPGTGGAQATPCSAAKPRGMKPCFPGTRSEIPGGISLATFGNELFPAHPIPFCFFPAFMKELTGN